MFLIGGAFVRIAGRDGHRFDTKPGKRVEHFANTGRIGVVKKRGVRGDSEASIKRRFGRPDGDVVDSVSANGFVMFFAGTVEMDREAEIF